MAEKSSFFDDVLTILSGLLPDGDSAKELSGLKAKEKSVFDKDAKRDEALKNVVPATISAVGGMLAPESPLDLIPISKISSAAKVAGGSSSDAEASIGGAKRIHGLDKVNEFLQHIASGKSKGAEADFYSHGMYYGPVDNKLRGVIPNDELQLLPDFFRSLKRESSGLVQDYVIDPKLFKVYPELADFEMEFRKMAPERRGSLIPGKPDIRNDETGELILPGTKSRVLVNSVSTVQDAVNTILHELQHGIQNIDGLARGTSLNNVLTSQIFADSFNDPRMIKEALSEMNKSSAKNFSLSDILAYKIYAGSPGEAEARAVADMFGLQRHKTFPLSVYDTPVKDLREVR